MRVHSIFNVVSDKDELEALRFWVMYRLEFGHPGGCWIWKGPKTKRAKRRLEYGRFTTLGVSMYAHVLFYELEKGRRVPRNRVLRHTCNRSLCCNPAHLKPGSQRENVRDAIASGSHWSPRGDFHHSARLSHVKAKEMRNRSKTKSIAFLMKYYGVSESTVRRTLAGKIWK